MGYMAGDEEEGERMAEERIPEAWIGGYVIMMPTADITMEHVVLLRDVRDFGSSTSWRRPAVWCSPRGPLFGP
jgi:hypothetical protein